MQNLKPFSIISIVLAVISLSCFLATIGDSFHLYQDSNEQWLSVLATDFSSDFLPSVILSLLIIGSYWIGLSGLLSMRRQVSLLDAMNLSAFVFTPLYIGFVSLLRFLPGIANYNSGLLLLSTTLTIPIFIIAVLLMIRNIVRLWQYGESSFDNPFMAKMSDRQIGWLIFVVTCLIFLISIPPFSQSRPFDGDQPHYLIATHSLLEDGDIYIEDDHNDKAYKSFTQYEIKPQYYRRTVDAKIIPAHKFGISILAVLPYFLAGRLGALLMIGLMASLAAANTYWLTMKIVAHRKAAIFATLAVVFTVPALPMSQMFFTEIPSALFLLVAINMLLRPTGTMPPRFAYLLPFIIWAMPWLHIRNYMVAFVLTGMLLWQLRKSKAKLVSILVLSLLLALAVPAFNLAFYGDFSPVAEMGGGQKTDLHLLNVFNGAGALIFDQEFGAVLYNPILLLVIFGIIPFFRRNRTRFLQIFLLFGVSLGTALLYTMWWGGGSPPARYLASVIHLAAIPLAFLIVHYIRWRGPASLLLAISIAISSSIIFNSSLLINVSDGSSQLLTSLSIGFNDAVEWWPSWISGGFRAWPLALILSLFLTAFIYLTKLFSGKKTLQAAIVLPLSILLFIPYSVLGERFTPDEPNGLQPTSHAADALLHLRYRNEAQLIDLHNHLSSPPLPSRRFSGHLIFGQANLHADEKSPRGRSRLISTAGEVITLSVDTPFAAGRYRLLLCARAEGSTAEITVTMKDFAQPLLDRSEIFDYLLSDQFTVESTEIVLKHNSSDLQFRLSPSTPVRFRYFILQPLSLQTRLEFGGAAQAFARATWNFGDFVLSSKNNSLFPPSNSQFWTRADSTDEWIVQSDKPFSRLKLQLSSRAGVSLRIISGQAIENVEFQEGSESREIVISPKIQRTEAGQYFAILEVATNGYFIPAELNPESNDRRKLAVRVKIILE